MTDEMFTIIIIYGLITFVISIIVVPSYEYFYKFYLISGLKQLSKMNLFGCICSCIFMHIITPWIGIPVFIYWLFHVGRKE